MAVPGRKSDFNASVFQGSAEDFHHSCNPCLADGQCFDAHGYCVDCQEYLCKDCFKFHKKASALKHHQLLDKNNLEKADTAISYDCTEKCAVHKKEVIKYFCHKHEVLGCNDCILMNHKTCEVDYIPDKCADIGNSAEFRDILGKLDEKEKVAENITDRAIVRDNEIDVCYEKVIKEMIQHRKEINIRLDQLQKTFKTEAGSKKTADKGTVKEVLDTCATISSEIKTIQSNLHDCVSSRRNGQLYISIKQAESKLKSFEVEKAQQSLETTNTQYTFQRGTDLDKMLPQKDTFGKLKLSSIPVHKRIITALTPKSEINVKTKYDGSLPFSCYITGCDVLASNDLVLVDNNKNKLKFVNTESKSVTEEKSLDSYPYDIVVLPKDQIAVTMPEKEEVIIMTYARQTVWDYFTMKPTCKMPVVRRIPAKGKCKGITYKQNNIYVVCKGITQFVLVFDMQSSGGNIIPIHKDIKDPCYIVVSEDSDLMYISDYSNNRVVSITLQGDIAAVYEHKDLAGPMGIVLLDENTLLVCCFKNGTIHRISGDLKQGQMMIAGLGNPRSICYNPHQHELCLGSDQLKVFSVK